MIRFLRLDAVKAISLSIFLHKTKYYIGLELNKKAKETAESNGIKVENITVEDYSKKYPETFDVVVSFQVLEHVSDPKGFIEAKIKLLKKEDY